MIAWVTKGRAHFLGSEGHTFVFFNVISKINFTQQAFSKFMARGFMRITNEAINLQRIRRMVAEGVWKIYYQVKNVIFQIS